MNHTRLAAALLASALLGGGLVAATAPAQADTPGCVSKPKVRRIEKGMTKKHVHRIFDTAGRFADGAAGGYTRGYRYCVAEPDRRVYVSYAPRRGAHRVIEMQTSH